MESDPSVTRYTPAPREHIFGSLLGRHWVLIGFVVVVGTAVAATALPLLVYTVSLAVFGLAHVLAELRYVDSRFSARIGRRLLVGFVTLLAAIVWTRIAYLAGWIPGNLWMPLELGLVVLLGALVMPILVRRGFFVTLIGVVVLGGIGLGAALWPIHTMLALALLHNLTPVAFLAERLRGRQRRQVMFACLVGFVLVPLFLASGVPLAWLMQLDLFAPDLGLFASAGGLDNHMDVFVPPELMHRQYTALSFFAAAVYLQCMHYFVVIHVLPRLDSDEQWVTPHNVVRWPKQFYFLMILVGAGGVLLLGFVASFADARGVYGLAAAVHAWIEIPILLLALALPAEAARRASAGGAETTPGGSDMPA